MILHCPLCHGQFSIEGLTQDQAGRDLLMLIARAGHMGPALLSYLTLFRSQKRALAFDRALRLAREVMEIPAAPEHLAAAMAETVEALRGKGGKPLKNHNYLKRVLESQPQVAMPAATPAAVSAPEAAPAISKTARAIGRLEGWKNS